MTDSPQVADRMTRGVRSMAPTDSMQLAAQAMDELDVGAIPVCEDGRVIGLVTDRDIAIRGVAQGLDGPSTPLSEVMSTDIECVREDDSLDEVLERMRDLQVRRLPVLDDQGELVGMLSLGDVAAKAESDEDSDAAGDVLADISEPAEPDRSNNSAAGGAAGGGSASGQASRRQP